MSSPAGGTAVASAGLIASGAHGAAPSTDFGLWARRQVVFQMTLGESLILRDAEADRLARTVPVARAR